MEFEDSVDFGVAFGYPCFVLMDMVVNIYLLNQYEEIDGYLVTVLI